VICYAGVDAGVPELNDLSDLRLARIALIGAVVAALGVAGCGRKGGLDPPPGASAVEPGPGAQTAAGPELGPDGRPVVAPPPAIPRRTPIDFLID
jgi:predicted small lipoprotein YifL